MIDLTMMRWRIERDYHELKQEVGLGHFEGREWRGFKELRVLKNVLSGCQPSSCVRRAAVVGLIWPGRQRVGGLCNSSISLSFGGPTEILISERHSPGAIQTRKVIMAGFAKRFVRDESGATAIEYGLIASLISVAIIASAQKLGTDVANTLGAAANSMSTTK